MNIFPVLSKVSSILLRSKSHDKLVNPSYVQIGSLCTLFHKQTNEEQESFLKPVEVNFVPFCGLKVRGLLKRRCKDCYFVRRQERLYVMCDAYPRHKQMSMVKKEKNTWILSHATQGKVRPW